MIDTLKCNCKPRVTKNTLHFCQVKNDHSSLNVCRCSEGDLDKSKQQLLHNKNSNNVNTYIAPYKCEYDQIRFKITEINM